MRCGRDPVRPEAATTRPPLSAREAVSPSPPEPTWCSTTREACLALSRVLAAAGDIKGANGARDDADRLYAAKEVASSIGRAAEPVAPVPPHRPPPRRPRQRRGWRSRTSPARSGRSASRAVRAQATSTAPLAFYSDQFVYDDRRRLSGDPIRGRDALRAAIARVIRAIHPVSNSACWRFAVSVCILHWSRWSDDDGNETTTLYVNETDDDGRVSYRGRFDEDDFEGAYRELEHRYYAGEGAAFAEGGSTRRPSAPIALDRGIIGRVFDELCNPRSAHREQIALGLRRSLRRGTPCRHRGTQRDGRLFAIVARGRVLAVADLGHGPRSSARPSGTTARSTHGHGSM